MDSRAERYNECMARLQELEQEGKIFVIAPESTYGVGRTTTDVIKLRRLYDEGYELTKSACRNCVHIWDKKERKQTMKIVFLVQRRSVMTSICPVMTRWARL